VLTGATGGLHSGTRLIVVPGTPLAAVLSVVAPPLHPAPTKYHQDSWLDFGSDAELDLDVMERPAQLRLALPAASCLKLYNSCHPGYPSPRSAGFCFGPLPLRIDGIASTLFAQRHHVDQPRTQTKGQGNSGDGLHQKQTQVGPESRVVGGGQQGRTPPPDRGCPVLARARGGQPGPAAARPLPGDGDTSVRVRGPGVRPAGRRALRDRPALRTGHQPQPLAALGAPVVALTSPNLIPIWDLRH
jgi:hypothetical protein